MKINAINKLKKILFTLSLAALLFSGCKPTVDPSGTETETEKTQPAAVTNFKAKGANQKVKLSWTNPKATSFSGLTLLWGTDSENLTESVTLTKDDTSTTITELTNDTTYYFQMEANFGTDDDGNDIVKTSSIISATPKDGIPSVDFAKEMTIGWNLGNTFDADTETAWGAPKTTKAMIDAVKAAGFETIRIPVSWSKHVDSSYNIDSTWMNRVKEVVDYAVANDMYIILNVHHDNYSESEIDSEAGFCVTTDSSKKTKSKDYLSKVWTQIATTFAAYDEKLVFEVLNEPRAVGTDWEWGFYSDSARAKAKDLCDVITEYEETCISAIRAVPGNEDRFLMVPGYAASGADSSMLAKYTMPDNDTANDKLILSTHAYSPFNFAMGNADKTFGSDDKSSLDSIFNYLKTTYTDKGIGVVMGEASASNKGNTDERIKWAEYYFGKAKNAGIPVVLWDNMVFNEDGHENVAGGYNGEHHGWLCRTKGTWYFPTIIKAMMDTVGVTGYSIPEYVILTPENIGWNESAATTLFTGSLNTDWTAKTFDKSKFSGAKAGSILKVSCNSATSGAIRMINSDWTVVYNQGEIVNAVDGGENFNVSAGAVDVYYILTASDAAAWKANGFGIVGPGLTITSIKFMN